MKRACSEHSSVARQP